MCKSIQYMYMHEPLSIFCPLLDNSHVDLFSRFTVSYNVMSVYVCVSGQHRGS